MNTKTRSLVVRIVVAFVVLAAFAVFVGKQIAPTVPTLALILYAFTGAGLVLVAFVALAVPSLTIRRFVLRNGGTDPQWFWFDREPPGLERWREESRAVAAHEDVK